MSTILDALNKYKQEKEEREGAERDRERFLDGDSGGNGGEPPDDPPGPGRDHDRGPGGRSMALVAALAVVFLIIVIGGGGYLFFLVSRQNEDFSKQMVDARIKQENLERELEQARKERAALAAKPTPVQTIVIHVTPEPTPTPRPTPRPTLAPPQNALAQQQPAAQQTDQSNDVKPSGGVQTVRGDVLGLNVGGVMWDPMDPACLIDGNILSEGQSVKGFKVIKIDRESIHLQKGTTMYRVLY